ncbi:hypothetical protein [Conexibacter sp. SYSU D00693]|uniref:GspE/PulE/PilB domain-containing protein n=1 Tax=Conexibacter sp. SYSU D00693 TaxID=2812560 RepID=UPI00196B5EC1|nr:hypothetical protein [Conexibacter sp. SYSU D00693]
MDPALAIAHAAGLPYSGLRDVTPDARLLRYVPPRVAREQKVVPVVLVGDTLKVASATAHPDLHAVTDAFPGLTIDLVVAPEPEMDAVLGRLEARVP